MPYGFGQFETKRLNPVEVWEPGGVVAQVLVEKVFKVVVVYHGAQGFAFVRIYEAVLER